MVDDVGREVATVTVGASPDGYGVLLAWAVQQAPGRRVFGRWKAAARTALGCYALLAAGQQVVEAGRPQRVGRRPGGTSARPTPSWPPAPPWPQTITPGRAATATGRRCASCWGPRTRQHHPHRRDQRVQGAAADRTRPAARAGTPTVHARQTAACAALRVHPPAPPRRAGPAPDLRSLAQRIRLLDKEIRANERELHALVDAPPTRPVGRTRRRSGQRGPSDHRLVAPRPMPLRSRLRRARRGQPAAGILRPRQRSPSQPLRRPPTQPCPAHHRELAHDPGPRTHPALPHPATRPPEVRRRDPPLPQPLHRKTPVPTHGNRRDGLTDHRSVNPSSTSDFNLPRRELFYVFKGRPAAVLAHTKAAGHAARPLIRDVAAAA
jgi:hypothetical protein